MLLVSGNKIAFHRSRNYNCAEKSLNLYNYHHVKMQRHSLQLSIFNHIILDHIYNLLIK